MAVLEADFDTHVSPCKAPLGLARASKWLVLAAGVGLLAACRTPEAPPCVPDDIEHVINVAIMPKRLNPDESGQPLSVEFKLYQVAGSTGLDTLVFDEVWQKGAEAIEAEVLATSEFTLYPSEPKVLPIKPEDGATHLLALAIFREHVGRTWYRVYEIPQNHADAVCRARQSETPSELPDPCFYVLAEGTQIYGGPTPPPGFDAKLDLECAPPQGNAPAADEDGEDDADAERDGKKSKSDD